MKRNWAGLLAALGMFSLLAGCKADTGSEAAPQQTQPETVQTQQEQTQQPEQKTPQEYAIKIPMGEQTTCDLDGDGTQETICCSTTLDENDMPLLSILINGTECFSAGMRNWDFITDSYYVTNLFENDLYQEIAIGDNGPSSDPITVFYGYHDGFLEEIGEVSGFIGETVTISGDSTLTAIKRLHLLQTWWGETTWVLNENNQLQEQPQALYYPTKDSCVDVTLCRDILVYCGMDVTAQTITLQSDTPVRLYATDDKNWVGFYAQDVLYWVYIEDGWNIRSDGQSYAPDEVFQGLWMAD